MEKVSKKQTKETPLLHPEHEGALTKLFPDSGKILLTGGGKQLVERIGIEAIRNAVFCVLSGENLRSQTEPLSRRRIAQISGAVIAMFARGYHSIHDFQNKLSYLAVDQMRSAKRANNAEMWPAQWVIGLTGKSVQNVLRSDTKQVESYIKEFDLAIKDAAKHCREQIGNYNMVLGFEEDKQGKKVELEWEGIVRLTTAIGAQTLAIRGSEKSMYGKLFERLVLGSFLTLLGFKRVDRTNNKETRGVFWLSDSSDDREADATAIVAPGKIARFDIGFIGSGNSEISKDKLSRFGRELEVKGASTSSVTFVVVDKLPQTGKTLEAARKIKAEIVQMSMQYWPKELSNKLYERFGYEHEILKVEEIDLHKYLQDKLKNIAIEDFLNDVSVEKITDDPVEEAPALWEDDE